MKNLLLLIFLLTGFKAFTQREKFKCESINTNLLLEKYGEFKSYGLEIKQSDNGKTIDFMRAMILELDYTDLRQLCINAWSEVNNNGENSCYTKFLNNFSFIDKNFYLENIDYIEILVQLNKMIKNSM